MAYPWLILGFSKCSPLKQFVEAVPRFGLGKSKHVGKRLTSSSNHTKARGGPGRELDL